MAELNELTIPTTPEFRTFFTKCEECAKFYFKAYANKKVTALKFLCSHQEPRKESGSKLPEEAEKAVIRAVAGCLLADRPIKLTSIGFDPQNINLDEQRLTLKFDSAQICFQFPLPANYDVELFSRYVKFTADSITFYW